MFSSLNRIIKLAIIVVIIISILTIVLIELTLQPILHSICETDVKGMLTTIINEAVNSETDTISYNDLVTIQTNRQGHIILMQPNLQIVNDISSNITLAIQRSLEEFQTRVIKIPISQVFGIEILSRFSPLLAVHVIPYGSIESNIIDGFESVGINQTRHKIYLSINTKVKVVVPLISTDIKVNTSVPLTEAVIVGQVPQVYVGMEKGLFNDQKEKRSIK